MKIFLAGNCPICNADLSFEQDDQHSFYQCTKEDHFSGIAPASWSLDKVLSFDLAISAGDTCPTCGTQLSIREDEKAIHHWCASGHYAKQEPKNTTEPHPYKGPEWIEWNPNNEWYPEGYFDK